MPPPPQDAFGPGVEEPRILVAGVADPGKSPFDLTYTTGLREAGYNSNGISKELTAGAHFARARVARRR
jgi:hypothetical protein